MELFISITTGQIRDMFTYVYILNNNEAIKSYKKRRVLLLLKLVNQNGLWVGVT